MSLGCRLIAAKNERRNTYMNLAYTGPIDNTNLQGSIPYAKVANMAMDMFCDTSVAAPASGAEDKEIDDDQPKQSLLEVVDGVNKGKPWNIPEQVERGFEIPICITETFAIPELGKFKRLSMDAVVNAVWLALFWAKKEGNALAVSALKSLILDWPMDFVLIEGSTPEELDENMFKWSVNMSAKVERLRDFVGLENTNMMRIVAKAAHIVTSSLVSGKKASAAAVHTWMDQNIRWGAFQRPDVATVERHMRNWAAIQKCQRALALIEAALQRWGRNNLLDWPTKVQIIVQKSDAHSLLYVIEVFYTQMWRKNTTDPYGAAELKRIIPELLWVRSYVRAFVQKYSEAFKAKNDAEDSSTESLFRQVRHCLDSPAA